MWSSGQEWFNTDPPNFTLNVPPPADPPADPAPTNPPATDPAPAAAAAPAQSVQLTPEELAKVTSTAQKITAILNNGQLTDPQKKVQIRRAVRQGRQGIVGQDHRLAFYNAVLKNFSGPNQQLVKSVLQSMVSGGGGGPHGSQGAGGSQSSEIADYNKTQNERALDAVQGEVRQLEQGVEDLTYKSDQELMRSRQAQLRQLDIEGQNICSQEDQSIYTERQRGDAVDKLNSQNSYLQKLVAIYNRDTVMGTFLHKRDIIEKVQAMWDDIIHALVKTWIVDWEHVVVGSSERGRSVSGRTAKLYGPDQLPSDASIVAAEQGCEELSHSIEEIDTRHDSQIASITSAKEELEAKGAKLEHDIADQHATYADNIATYTERLAAARGREAEAAAKLTEGAATMVGAA